MLSKKSRYLLHKEDNNETQKFVDTESVVSGFSSLYVSDSFPGEVLEKWAGYPSFRIS